MACQSLGAVERSSAASSGCQSSDVTEDVTEVVLRRWSASTEVPVDSDFVSTYGSPLPQHCLTPSCENAIKIRLVPDLVLERFALLQAVWSVCRLRMRAKRGFVPRKEREAAQRRAQVPRRPKAGRSG
jgi:hypothetical protein